MRNIKQNKTKVSTYYCKMRMRSVLNREFFNWNQLNFEFYANWRRKLQVYEKKRKEDEMKWNKVKYDDDIWYLLKLINENFTMRKPEIGTENEKLERIKWNKKEKRKRSLYALPFWLIWVLQRAPLLMYSF